MSYQQEQMNNLLYKNNIQNNNISTNSNNIIILNSNPNINNSYSLNNPLIPAASGKGNNSFDNTNNDINPNIEHNLVNKAGAAVREPYLDNSFDNSLERAQKLDRLKKYSIIPYVICGMAAILSALIGILGIAFLNKTISSVSTCLIISGFSSMVIFIFGILAFYFYINDHSETTVMETPKQSIKRELLNIFIYLIIILLFIFAIFVIGTLVNRHEARSFLTGLGQNAEDWRKVYGNETYSNIESLISALIYSVGIISLVMIFIISIILILTYCFLETYRFVQTLAMFFSFVFFTIGCCLVYLALFADLFKDVANIQNTIPPWIPLAVLIAGGITLAFGLFGYISILVASKSLIKIFSTICGVFGIFVFACTVYSYIYSYRIKNLFESNCKDIIEMLPQDFLIKYVGCSRKYVYISNHLISECPKDRNMIAWEVNQETIKNLKAENPDIIFDNIPLTYGCYDNLCCTQAYNFISTNYLSLFSGFLLISTFICSLSSFLFCMELEGGNNTYYNKSFFSLSNMLIILLMIGATTTLILAAIKIPEKPNEDPTRVKPNPSVKNSVPKDLIVWKNLTESNIEHIAAIKNDIAQFTNITEIKTSCGNDCPDIRYTFKLSSQDGSFMRNKTSKWKNIIVEEDKSAGGVSDVIYQGSSDNLHPYFYYFDFIPSCPIKPTSFNISVSAEVKPVTSFLELKSKKLLHTLQKSNLQNRMFSSYLEVNQSDYKNNHGYTVDYSKYKLGDRFQIFSHKIDYSFVSNKSQIIIGSVVKRINSTYIIPVEKATIKITSLDFPECQTSTILTDKDGNFVSDKLYIYDTGLKTNYLITVTANDLTKHERIISTGGIGAPEEIDLGKFELWSTAILDSTHISSFILDALDNAPLRDVKVSLFTGYKKSNIEEDNNAKAQAKSVKPSFIQLKTNKKASLLKDPGTIQLKAPTTMLHNELLKAFISNERGIYAFYDVSPGQYSLEFEKEGYYKEILSTFFYIFKKNK